MCMGHLPDTYTCGLCIHRECRKRFPRHRGLAIPTCITCVTDVPWCVPGSLTGGFPCSRWRRKTFPAFPVRAQSAILRIWWETHVFLSRRATFPKCWSLFPHDLPPFTRHLILTDVIWETCSWHSVKKDSSKEAIPVYVRCWHQR